MSGKKMIVGLGNPGSDYQRTRHNIGFLVLEELARQCGVKLRPSTVCRGRIAFHEFSGIVCGVLIPMTFMNQSGIAVRKIVDAEAIEAKDILVVCDDFNLPLGQLRIRREGSDGGHNGLSSIISLLGTEAFPRLRVGIGSPSEGQDPAEFVLKEFARDEKEQVDSMIRQTVDCCLAWISNDLEQVMTQFNKRKGNGQI